MDHIVTSDINGTSSTNSTRAFPQLVGYRWTSLNIFGLLVIIIGAILNFSLLAVFIKRRSLRNSFGVYLINLLLLETVLLWVRGIINLVYAYLGNWPFGYSFCLFVTYVGYAYETLIILAHFLIALNRVWAVTFPFCYRTRHSVKFTIVLCSSVFILMHLAYIPVSISTVVVIPGSVMYSYSCDVDTTNVLYVVSELGLFLTPMILGLSSYPYVCYKSFFSDRKARIAPHTQSVAAHGHYELTHPSATVGTMNDQGTGAPKDKLRVCGRELRGSVTGFVTLTLMTLSVAVCLVPKESLFTYLIWSSAEPPGLMAVFDVLQRLITVFDPILIAVGNTEIRTMLRKRFLSKGG